MCKRLVLIGLIIAFALALPASATTYLFTWGDGNNSPVGLSHTFLQGTMDITAYVFYTDGTTVQNGITNGLYSKNKGGDETGLGTTADPGGSHEIVFNDYVQLDFSDVKAKYNITSATLAINSSTGSDAWKIYGSATKGGTLSSFGTALHSGSVETAFSILADLTNPNINFLTISESAPCGDVLVGALTLTATPKTPEPVTALLIGGSLVAIGLLHRRKRRH